MRSIRERPTAVAESQPNVRSALGLQLRMRPSGSIWMRQSVATSRTAAPMRCSRLAAAAASLSSSSATTEAATSSSTPMSVGVQSRSRSMTQSVPMTLPSARRIGTPA